MAPFQEGGFVGTVAGFLSIFGKCSDHVGDKKETGTRLHSGIFIRFRSAYRMGEERGQQNTTLPLLSLLLTKSY